MIWRVVQSKGGVHFLGCWSYLLRDGMGHKAAWTATVKNQPCYRFEGYEISLYDWVILRICFHMSIDGRLNEMTLTGSYRAVSCASGS